MVLPPDAFSKQWRMWYYGRDQTEWARGGKPFLPTGRIGFALSEDGLRWTREAGALPAGAVMDPTGDLEAFDNLHIGVGDVVQLPNGTLWMYYFGGREDDGSKFSGLGMQIGLAASEDGGLTWTRLNDGKPVLKSGAKGEFDEIFVSWPRVLPPWKTESVPGLPDGTWYLSYHTFNLSKWSAGAATSDDGISWRRLPGPVLVAGGDGSWDSRGVGVRSVAALDGKLQMLYEAVDDDDVHHIGVAESSDGVQWLKRRVAGLPDLGGPVLTKGPSGAFDDKHVGTPFLVPPTSKGGNWRLYFVGASKAATMGKPGLAIGLAESDGDDLTRWHKVSRE